ncbi:hypothetical protein BKA62DRAFT_298611 [Auriculariales sp. MPI-PUGE-AT-0066]|nr:hypothetical protein BKA62DRAFT_298611 [Auriculariales sp. MPI-PUGE-AT-0066]
MAAFAQSPPPPLHTTAHGPHALPHHPQLQPQHLHNHQLHTPPSVVTHSPALTSSAPAPRNMPKVGETRCYWALLDDRLEFLFLDPVLGHHLEDQKDALLGRSLLEFVHPDELASARQDLQGMLDSRTLHGSVTRVRFSRLSSIRRRLGFQGIPVIPQFMEQGGVFFDNEYMPVNLVINVASDGLILCFIHAVVDIKPTEDNDEQKRNCWTNWCGTQAGGLSHENSTALRQTLSQRNMPHSELPHGRVFQILRHVPGRPCIFSWPSDLPNNDFAQLANRIEMEVPGFTDSSTSSAGSTPATATSAKTSCTRRYKSEMNIPCSDQLERDIESIFVPYGCIIFACHRTKSARRIPQPAMYPQPVPYPYEHPAAFAGGPPAPAFGQWNGNNTAGASGSWPGYDGPQEASAHRHNSFDSARSPSESTSSSARNSQTLPEPPLGRQSPSGGDSGGDEGERRRSRVGGAPPQGVTRCSNCKIKQSPEWRKGPSGKKDLCNACVYPLA